MPLVLSLMLTPLAMLMLLGTAVALGVFDDIDPTGAIVLVTLLKRSTIEVTHFH